MKNLFLWLKYTIVKYEPTLNFEWLKQSTMTAFSSGTMLRGQILNFPASTTRESGIPVREGRSFVVLNATETTLTISRCE